MVFAHQDTHKKIIELQAFTRRPTSLAVLDGATPYPELLVAAADPGTAVVWETAQGDDPVAAALTTADAPIDTLHVVSHGAPGRLTLGGRSRDARAVAAMGRRWRRHLATDATIVLYGCSAGQGSAGRRLVRKLARATGARVLASSTPTGAAAQGGDWRFDVSSAGRYAAAASAFSRAHATWPGLLAHIVSVNTDGSPTPTGSFRAATEAAAVGVDFNITFDLASPDSINLTEGPVTIIGGTGPEINFGDSSSLTISGNDIVFSHSNTLVFLGGNVTQTVTLASNLTGSGGLRIDSAAGDLTVVLSGTNTLNSAISVSGGDTLSISSDANLGAGTITISTGTLRVTGATTIDNQIRLINTETIDTGADVTISSVVSDTGGGSLTKTGTGTLTLSGTNTYAGTTTVSAGTLSISGDGNLGTGALTLNGGNLTVTGATTIDNAIALGSSATVTNSAAVTLSGGITGANNLTKAGTGTLTLSNTNGYTGTTAVTAGTLSVNGALTGTTTVSVASGATLAGSGNISGAVTVASGGSLTPGNSAGKLSTGNLTLASGSSATFEVGGTIAGTDYDQIDVSGTVNITGSTLSISVLGTSTTGNTYMLIANEGVDPVAGTFSGLAEGATITASSRTFTISYAAGTGNDIVLTDTTPAPSSDSGGSGSSATAGTGGADTLTGGGNADVIRGQAGNDTILGLGGNDSLSGGAGVDRIEGGIGSDVVYGNTGDDVLYGNTSDDTIYGGQDADVIYGGHDQDVLYGNRSDDAIWGNTGNDTLFGGQGNDQVAGGAGADRLFGNLGADTLAGGAGDDTLNGGEGADQLFFADGGGADLVEGFVIGEDLLVIAANVNGTGVASAGDLFARAGDDGFGNTLIDLGAGNSVTLVGIATAQLSADSFLIG